MTTAWYVDCDGSLVEFTTSYGDIFVDACVECGLDAAEGEALLESYNEPFFEAFRDFHPDPYRVGMEAALAETGLSADVAPDADDLARSLRTTEVQRTEVREGTRETLDALADGGASLGVLTNGLADQQRRKLERHDLFERFDAYVPSYDVGAHKPDGAVFDAAREALPADDYVYVGDSEDHDVEPARAAGFFAVHLDHDAETGTVTVRDIGDLGELATRL